MSVLRRFSLPRSRPLPVYSQDDENLRHATWLELFLDLVFVLAVAELGGYLHGNLTAGGLIRFAVLFGIVWWVWLNISYFSDTYDTDDLTSHLMVILAMFGVIFLSRTVDGALEGESFAFAAGVLLLRLFLTASHLRAWHLRPLGRRFLTTWLLLEGSVTSVWAMSLLIGEPLRFGFWIVSFLLQVMGMAIIYLRFKSIIAPDASHCNERFGLFTILVLGETILAIGIGTSEIGLAGRTLLVGALGFVIVVAVWWLYFVGYQERLYERMLFCRTESWQQQRRRGLVHVYSHYAIHAGIVAAGVGIAVAMEAVGSAHAFDAGARFTLGLGLVVFLIGSGVSHTMGQSPIDGRLLAVRVVASILIGLVAVLGSGLSTIPVIGLVALVMVGVVVTEGLYLWVEPSTISDAA
jgi:low temperature requirement protein LtrA